MTTELKKRLITAAILILVLCSLLLAAKYSCNAKLSLSVIAILINIIAALEFSSICSRVNLGYMKRISYFTLSALPAFYSAAIIFSTDFCTSDDSELYGYPNKVLNFIFINFVLAFFYSVITSRNSLDKLTTVLGELVSGLFLVSAGSAALISLTMHPYSYLILAWLLIVVCVNDSAAYFTGLNFQSMNLFPAISPKKSLYGYLGGVAAGVLCGTAFSFLLYQSGFEAGYLQYAFISFLCVLAAQIGDLVASYLKRLYGAKDSGVLLPGHGGLLDRIDGLLFSAVVLCFFIY